MSNSRLQDPFLNELVATIRAGRKRVSNGLNGAYSGPDDRVRECFTRLGAILGPEEKKMVERILWDELRGTLHGMLVIFDGGTALADQGLISIQDEDGEVFDRHLHELAFGRLTPEELDT